MRVRRFSAQRRSALILSSIALSFGAVTCGKDTSSPPPGASQLFFKVDPVSAMAGSAVAPAVVVEARDGNGALVSDFTGDVTISLGANPGGGALGGTTTVNATGGVATFASLSIDKKGAGYRRKATSGSLTAAMSATFDISAANSSSPPNQTSVAGAGLAPAVTVSARDALGNVADGYTGSVTVSITNGTGAAGATLSGTKTVAAQRDGADRRHERDVQHHSRPGQRPRHQRPAELHRGRDQSQWGDPDGDDRRQRPERCGDIL